jgi:GNAT superfamily N-acetyltransferase
MKADIDIKLRRLASVDLDAANAVVEAAIMTWDLPERVKRLSLASYRYNVHDLEHLTIMGALDAAEAIVGVAAWEPASAADTPDGAEGLLLHGIYVIPTLHRTGIGSRLIGAAIRAARQGRFDGMLVKANPDAQGFFLARGMEPLAAEDARRDYPYRFWKDLKRD